MKARANLPGLGRKTYGLYRFKGGSYGKSRGSLSLKNRGCRRIWVPSQGWSILLGLAWNWIHCRGFRPEGLQLIHMTFWRIKRMIFHGTDYIREVDTVISRWVLLSTQEYAWQIREVHWSMKCRGSLVTWEELVNALVGEKPVTILFILLNFQNWGRAWLCCGLSVVSAIFWSL